MIIDAHVHIPGVKGENLGWPTASTVEEVVRKLDDAGIDKAVITSITSTVAKDMEGIRAGNRQMLATLKAYPGRFIGACQVHPGFPDESLRELRTMHDEHGIVWLGELCGYLGGYTYDTPAFARLIEEAARLTMIVQIHTQDMKGLMEMADRRPETPFVLAHMGGNPDYVGRVQAVAGRENIYIDISGSEVSRVGILEAYIREAGVAKVLFGTDYIVCEPVVYIARIQGLGLSKQDKENILWKNVQRLLDQASGR